MKIINIKESALMPLSTEKKREYARQWRINNPEKYQTIIKRYRDKDPEKRLERQRLWYRRNKDKVARYYKENYEKISKYQKEYREKNKEILNAKKRVYCKNYFSRPEIKEKQREYYKKYYLEHKDAPYYRLKSSKGKSVTTTI